MPLEEYYNYFLILWSSIAVIVFTILFFKDAPYGRFNTSDHAFQIPSRFGWIFMESPAVLGVLFCFYFFYDLIGMPQTLMCLIWLSHYLHRTLIWPLRAELHGRKMPLKIALLAFVFNTINIIIQCLWIFFLGNYLEEWITSGFFMLGCFIFYIGMYVNIYSDNILMNLRKTKGNGYHIPEGFLFKYVSCPNYLGEIIEWLGWAILTLSPAGLVFFIWTFSNLVPRAKANHQWAIERIENYPKGRKSVFPFLY